MPPSTSIPFPDSDAFRARLRQCADKLGSVNALAKASGIPQSTIHKYFTNSEPSRHNIVMIARAAQVNAGWLAAGETAADAGNTRAVDPATETEFQRRFDALLNKHGGVTGLSSLSKIAADRLAQVKAGGELSRSEWASLAKAATISLQWLLGGENEPTTIIPEDAAELLEAIHHDELQRELKELLLRGHSIQPSWQPKAVDFLAVGREILTLLPRVPLIPFTLRNDSMEPTLSQGDFLIFCPSLTLKQPGIYLFQNRTDHSNTIARVAIKPNKVSCGVDNPKYERFGDFEYNPKTYICHGRLILKVTPP